MGLWNRAREVFFGRRRALLSRARREEALGRLDEATALYLEAEAPAQAARLFALPAEAAKEPERRIFLLGQAAAHSPEDEKKSYEVRRARIALELVKTSAIELTQAEIRELGKRLELLAEPALAAEAYALGGDADAEARMLVEAGAIERLENMLDRERERDRAEIRRHEIEARVRDLVSAGRRREALVVGADSRVTDPRINDVLREVEGRRLSGPRVELELDGEKIQLVFGERVVIGRAGAAIVVVSPAVSREHLAISSGPNGPQVEDLGSRNGTLLRGVRVEAPVAVGGGIELALGGEVPVSIEPWKKGVRIRVASDDVCAPLGALEIDGWHIRTGTDDWIELEARAPACLDGLWVDGVIELCTGDAIAASGSAAPRLRVPR